MSRWRNTGGWNKSRGTVEETPRIDSYEAGAVEGWGCLLGDADKGGPLVLDCLRYIDYGSTEAEGREVIEVWHKDGWSRELELSRKENGFGGNQAFFLCPACGERRRYLYQVGATFLCRKCSRLNYRSQQETRSGSMYYHHKGLDLVEKHLEPPPGGWIDGFSFCGWTPERPRYMHQSTYGRYLRRFAKYQDKHQRRQLEDVAKLLRIFK